jgi:WD40 repeat protein
MFPSTLAHICVMAVMLGTTLSSFDRLGGQEPNQAGRSDLPPGAVLRLGSGRFLHGGEIRALAFAPNGKLLASASANRQDPTIRLWDVQTGREAMTLKGHKGMVAHLAFLPGGDAKAPAILVSGGGDSTIRFWNVKTGAELPQVINHPGPVAALAISPDGKKIATGSASAKQVFLWDTTSGNELRRWEAHEHGVVGLCFGSLGKTLASAGGIMRTLRGGGPRDDKTLALWDSGSGKLLKHFTGHDFEVTGIVLSPDGKILIAGGPFYRGGSPVWWDTETGKKLHNARTSCYGIALTPGDKTIAVADMNEIHFFDVETAAPQQPLRHKHRVFVKAMAFSPDGSTLATGGDEGRIVLWDARRRTQKGDDKSPSHDVRSVAVSRDGTAILTLGGDGAVLWDRSNGRVLRKLEPAEDKRPRPAASASFLPDQRTLLLTHWDEGISYWNWKAGTHERDVSIENDFKHRTLSVSADGSVYVTGGHQADDLLVRQASNGKVVRKLPAPVHKGRVFVRATALSPNGEHLLAVGLFDQQLYELETGKPVYKTGYSGFAPAFSPGGVVNAIWALKSFPNAVELTETATGKELARFTFKGKAAAHAEHITFSPDGRMVILVESGLRPGDVGTAYLFEIATGKLLKTLSGHRGKIHMAAFTPDSKALVTGSDDGTALVWDLTGLLAPEKVDVKACWGELAMPERRTAYGAFCRLRAVPDAAVPFLKQELIKAAPVAELELLRRAWAIRLLEDVASASAREVLQDLARDNAEAQAALRRLQRRVPRP